MRFSFDTRRPWSLKLHFGGAACRDATVPFERQGLLGVEWKWTWIDGREFRWQVPREGETTGWKLSGSDGLVWTGEVHQHFLFWKSQGLVWTCVGQPKIVRRRRRLVRRFITVETDDGRMLGAWNACGCTVQGVVRESVAVDLGPIVIVAALDGWGQERTLIAG